MKVNQAETRGRFSNFLEIAGRYGATFGWLIRDAIWRFKSRIIAVLVIGFLGGIFQASALGQAVYYANIMEQGKVLKVMGMTFDPRTSVELLIFFAGGVSFAFLISGLMIYYARSRAIKIGCAYDSLCSRRVFSALGASQNIPTDFNGDICSDSTISRLAALDSRFCGRVLRILLGALIPTTTFLVYSGLLFYIHAGITVIILCLVGFSTVFLYRISKFGARSSIVFEQKNIGSRREKEQILKQLRGATTNFPDEHDPWIKKIFDDGDTKRTMDAYANRLVTVEYSVLVNNILGAIEIAIILLFFGGSAIMSGTGWGAMIVYFIAFRYCLMSFKKSIRIITSVNRFYPQLRRYRHFILEAGASPTEAPAEPGKYTIIRGANFISGSLQNWTIRKGQRVGLISPVSLNRYTLAFLVDCMVSPSKKEMEEILASTWFVTEQYGPPPIGLHRFLYLESDAAHQSLRSEMETLGIWEKFKAQMPENLEKPVSPKVWKKAEPDLKFALALLAAQRSGAWWIMIEESGLRSLTETAQKYLLDRLADRVVVIVSGSKMETTGNYGEDVFVILGEREVVGFGPPDWAKQHQEEIREVMAPALERFSDDVAEDDDDISLEDE